MTPQLKTPVTLSLSALATLALASACSDTHAASELAAAPDLAVRQADTVAPEPAAPTATDAPVLSLDDQPIAAYRTDLLELAFEAASAFPLHPFIKNRSRAQQEVVDASLALEQPRRALRYISGIENWRRGAGYADLATYCAERGATADAERFLELGEEIAREQLSEEDAQEWRTDRILAKASKAHLLLGNEEIVRELRRDVEASERGAVAAVQAGDAAEDEFEEQIVAAEASFATGGLDESRVGLQVCAALFKRFFEDEERRAAAVETFESAWGHVPPGVKIETLKDLIAFSLERGDRDQALELVDVAVEVSGQANWAPEDRVRVTAELARLRFRSGDERKAVVEIEGALELFDAEREQIVDMFRGGPLRALAEAYDAIGDEQAARMVYARAIQESLENVNPRPRADDLVATCISMAVHEVEPDEDLWRLLRGVRSKLAEVW